MKHSTRVFKFEKIYESIAIVEACVDNPGSFIELNWKDAEVIEAALKPYKITNLHRYIYAMISIEWRSYYKDNDDLFLDAYENDSEDEDIISELDAMFNVYEIDYISFRDYMESNNLKDDDEAFQKWFLNHEEAFEELWSIVTDEIFHILYSNRSFLLKFNTNLAKYLKQNKNVIPQEFLTKRGKVPRVALPQWVKRAVFYRDHGRCVFCQRDLSGLLTIQDGVHFDHIVPLNRMGTNDPSNFQLLCEECNLKKSGKTSSTSYRYRSWWDDE